MCVRNVMLRLTKRATTRVEQEIKLESTFTLFITLIMEDWRKIDIDALETDVFLTKEELVPPTDQTVTPDQVSLVINECKGKLTKGQFLDALRLGLNNPPYLTDELIKSKYNELMFEIFCSIKNNNADLTQFIQPLTVEEQDVLIKYLYKIMSTSYGSKQGGLLLNWYVKTVEITGLGPVIRYMSDRRTV